MTVSSMRLFAALLLICVVACASATHVEAFDCPGPIPRNFDRIDGNADPEKQRLDAEARAALANLRPIVLRITCSDSSQIRAL
jgi:hypothetical protein